MIKVTFNRLGFVSQTEIDQIRQGDSHEVLEATFEGKINANYQAKIDFTRPDGKKLSSVLMQPSSSEENKFTYAFNSLWFFALSGVATLTIYLIGANGQEASGQVAISVEKTDFSDTDVVLSPDEYEELLQLIASKLNITNGIIVLNEVPTEVADFVEGQIILVKQENQYTLYRRTDIGFTEIVDKNIEELANDLLEYVNRNAGVKLTQDLANSADDIIITTRLLNALNEVLSTVYFELDGATETKAGLMRVEDYEQLYTNLPNEIQNAVEKYGAHKVSRTEDGKNFDTYAQLVATPHDDFYYRGEKHELDPNDYAIVNKYGEVGNEQPARFTFDGVQWTFDYYLNELTEEQQKALNSGITAEKVEEFEQKSVVSVSTESVEEKPTIKSINVNGEEYNLGGGEVESVNGQTGEVVLTAQDIALESEEETIEDKLISQDGTLEDLQDQIDNLKSRGRYLSNWNATTGLPTTDPSTELPYEYRQGDYFIVGTVGTTNYRPSGTEYTGEASSELATETLGVGDEYIFDGQVWVYQKNAPIDLSAYAKDNEVVHLTGDETITGIKTIENATGLQLKFPNYSQIWKLRGGDVFQISKDNTPFANFNLTNSSIRSNFVPLFTNANDLGSTNNKWRDLYLNRNLTDGSNSIKVSDIAHKGQDTIDTSSTTYNGTLETNYGYAKVFTQPLTNLTITDFVVSTDDTNSSWQVRFALGTNGVVSLPSNVSWAYGQPTFEVGVAYTIVVEKGLAENTYTAHLILG